MSAARAFAITVGLVLGAPIASAEIPVRESFQLHCSGCHGPDGRGDGGFVPDLHSLAPLLEAEGGREYLARVPGVAQAPIESDALAMLLNFILAEMSGVRGFEPFAADEVERLRQRPLLDPVGERPLPR